MLVGSIEIDTVLRAMLSDRMITMEELHNVWLLTEEKQIEFIKSKL
jgi:hypothetical protein